MKLKQITRRSLSVVLALLMVLSTLFVGTVTAFAFNLEGTYYFDNYTAKWDNVYLARIGTNDKVIDYVPLTSGGDGIYSCNSSKWDGNGYYFANANSSSATAKTATFTSAVNSTNNCFVPSTTTGTGITGTWMTKEQAVANHSGSDQPISADLLSVLKNDKVMFYYGHLWSQDNVYLRTSEDKSKNLDNGSTTSVELTNNDNTQTFKYRSVAAASSAYYISNNSSWSGVIMAENAVAGKAYILNNSGSFSGNSSNNVFSFSAGTTRVTTTVTNNTINVGEKLSVSTSDPGTSVVGKTNSVQYYITKSSESNYTKYELTDGALDTSALNAGTYTLKTVLYDGSIYVVGAENEFTVTSSSARYTVNFGSNDDNFGTVSAKAGETTLITGDEVANNTTVNFTASAKEGYEVEGWYSDSNFSKKIEDAGTNTTYSTAVTVETNVYVKFNEETSDTPTPKYALCGDNGIGDDWGKYNENYLVDTNDTEVVSGNNNIFKRQVTIAGERYFGLITSDKTQYRPEGSKYQNDYNVIINNANSYENRKYTAQQAEGAFYIPSAGTYTIYVDQSETNPAVWVVKESVTVTYTVNAQSNNTDMGTVSPASKTCNSGGSVSFTATVNSGYVFAGWYDSSSYTYKIGSDLTLTLNNVTADRTVYAKFDSNVEPVTVYAMNPLNSSGYNNGKSATPVSMGETVLVKDLTGNIEYKKETNTDNSYNLYKITPGDVVTIKTQLTDKAVQANYYVYAFVINGETVLANNMGSGKYTASYTVGNKNLEIIPVYFNKTIKDNGDYITFYADTDEVLDKWGNTIACYAYYYDGTTRQEGDKIKPNAYEDAAYPSQPMLKNSQGQHFTVVPRYYYEYDKTEGTITKKKKEGTEDYYPITGVTLNNYYAKDSVHAIVSGQKEYLQTFDYDDFKYIADKKDADGKPLYDTIWFDNKYRANNTKYKDKISSYTVGTKYPNLVTEIAGINGWNEFYDGVNEETANKVGLLGDRDIDTNLPSLYVVSVGNIYDKNLGEWSVNWYVFDSDGKLLVIDHPSAFINENSSAYNLISGTNGTTDYSKNPVKITFETADTRNDGRWYYANSKKVDPYNIEVFAQYKSDDGSYVNCTNKNSDTTLPFVCDTYGFNVSIDGQAVKTYTEINNTAELKVNTLPDGWIFEGWGYIRQSDGVYVPFSSTDSLQTITLSGAGKFVARFKAVPKGSVALSHSMYDGPKALKGDGVRYIKAVLTDANGNTNVYDFTTGTIQIPDVTKGCTISITLKAVCTGINEFQTWYELVDGDYQIIGGEDSDQGKTGTVVYSWDLNTSDLFVGDKLTYSTLNFYSDIASKTAEATLTYNYKDRFNKDKSYIVKVTLTPAEIGNNYTPSEDTIYKNAPAIDDIYKYCIWKLKDVNRVSYGVSSATIEATHSVKLYTVNIVDSKAAKPKDAISDIPLNSYLKRDEQFIIAADPTSFKYWQVVTTADKREVAKCFSPTFNLVIADDYTITAVYDGKASSSVTIGDANYTREQYTDASGKPVDRLYADFIVAYMNQSHTKITDNPNKYHTGIIIEVDAKAKITVDKDGKPSNYKDVTFTSVNIQDCATGTGTGADIKADGYANVVLIDDGGGKSHKRIIYKHEIDNTKYNNFNRLDYFVSFKNSAANRLFVMKATYYVYYYDENGKIVYEESSPVYFNLYDIGTSAVETDK